MSIDLELLGSFCDEACDLLIRWESVCLELSKDRENNELMQELFRLAHNLKGGSKAVGLGNYGEFVHKIEDGITLVRDKVFPANDEIIVLFLESQKILIDWAEGLKSNPKFEHDACESFLRKYLVNFQNEKANLVNNADNSMGDDQKNVSVSAEINLDFKTEVSSEVKNNLDEDLSKKTNVVPINKNKVKIAKVSNNQNETIRISASKLDQLIQTIGELSIHQSIVIHTKNDIHSSNKIFTNSLQLSQKLTKELYDKALSLRMQPVSSVFQRLERTVLELSKTLEKPLNVHIHGGDVELDKTVIEKIIDPLTHIVRNAVDHGLEYPADRIIDGKSEAGNVTISAHQDTFGVVITINDDGKGLSKDRILNKAIEKKLINASQIKNEEDIFDLIFLPGFSTSDKITDVSGRGVGMNVVSTALEELQGQIKIESQERIGTSFVITLPTSVSIIEAMQVTLSGQNYVIPVGAIEEIINLGDHSLSANQKMFQLRDQVVPIQDLSESLVNKTNRGLHSAEGRSLLITKHGRDRVGFLVDEVLSQQQIVIRPLNEIIDGAYGLLGGTILGNGEPGLIVDIPRIAQDFIKRNKMKEMAA